MSDPISHDLQEIVEAISDGFCRDCLGAGELAINARQGYWGEWDCDYVPCPECNATGAAPVYDDGLTDAEYEGLRRAELGLVPCGLRSCQQPTSNRSGYCDSCEYDARADHESQRAS